MMAECISEEELWSRFRSKNDASARENLILKYMGLVKYVVDRLSMRPPSTIEYNDLYSCGIIGLVSAVDRFDPSLGNKFQTYAVCRIRGEILDESKRMGWVPRPLYKKNIEIEQVFASLQAQLGRPAEEEEVAEAMSIELGELQQAITDYSRASLASLYDIVSGNQGEDEEVYLIDLLGDPDTEIAESVEREEMEHLIAIEIDRLPEQEKKVVALYYKENLTLKEIGVLLRVTESRVSQIHAKAMLRIRGRLRTLLE
ncbi:TPA: FliA/WhiG family RNA polymerase sigma factor [Candidatus Poribacteria bacterium]|jgi:RNA polymerase sigma factor for flagellar operon FliA|nr:FliA/WhiG family RNA polymerase sigma factor [Candidatus Poribacteria bacterium]